MYSAWMRENERLDLVLIPKYSGRLGKLLFWISVILHDFYYNKLSTYNF